MLDHFIYFLWLILLLYLIFFYLFPPYFSSMVYIIFLFEFVLRHLIIQYLFLKWLFLLFSFWVPSILILFPLFFSHCGLSFCISDSRQILLEDSYCSFVSFITVFFFFVPACLEVTSYQRKIFYIFWFFFVVLNGCSLLYFCSYSFLNSCYFKNILFCQFCPLLWGFIYRCYCW